MSPRDEPTHIVFSPYFRTKFSSQSCHRIVSLLYHQNKNRHQQGAACFILVTWSLSPSNTIFISPADQPSNNSRTAPIPSLISIANLVSPPCLRPFPLPYPACVRCHCVVHNSADLLGPLSGTPDMTPAINIRPGSKDAIPAAPQAEFLPKDDLNAKLVGNVYPSASYENPEPLEKYDLVRRSVSTTVVNV